MKKISAGLVAAIVCFAGMTRAMEGVFDRSDEVGKYVAVVKEGTRGGVIDASKEIFDSGISDRRLGAALDERLLRDYESVGAFDKTGLQYLAWMIKALSSLGEAEYADDIKRVCARIKGTGSKEYCTDQLSKIGWYNTRNEIMSSRRNHRDGDDPQVSRLLNLLMTDDFSYKLYVADRMNWQKILDPRLTDAIERQVLQYMDSTIHGVSRDQAKAMGLFIKLLGYSGNIKYRDTLNKVNSSKATSLMKKYADESLKRLQN